ncbi:hypothetical protein D3C76_1881590 [compost metagenome]
MPWPGEQGLAAVDFGQLFTADPLLAAVGLARQNQQAAIIAKATQYGGATVVEDQQHRQV